MIEAIDQEKFNFLMADASQPLAFLFTANWCAPCKALKPTLDGMLQTVYSVDVDDSPDAVRRFDVRGVPTMVFVKAGAQVDRIVGAVPKTRIEDSFAKIGL